MPPKLSSFEPYVPGSSSLPLLVRMPDGERRQVDVAPTASVKDLKSTIAANIPALGSAGAADGAGGAEWDLDFGGSVLNEESNLNDYHIPDAYDHASGLLRTISDSAHTDAGKKVEALDKACAVVQGISRGERDMERLISAVFDEENNTANAGGEDEHQPSLRAMRRRGRSKLPSLNFGNLNPPGVSGGAPPTPSQLLRRLSTSRPDLYDPAVAARQEAGAGESGELKKNISWFPGAEGSGELKRGNTWFTDVISAIGNSVQGGGKDEDGIANGEEDVEGDSEGEAATSKQAPIQSDKVVQKEGVKEQGSTVVKAEDKKEVTKVTGEKTDAVPTSSAPSKAAVDNAGNSVGATTDSARSGQQSVTTSGEATGSVRLGSSATEAVSRTGDAAKSNADGISGSGAASGTSGPSATSGGEAPKDGAKSAGGLNTEKQMIGLQPEQTDEEIKLPKKRGRKRKNPHLTEEERKAQRQAQNRESAKLSRIRRKNMTIEYEKRVNTLEGENENLRDTVAALTDRLEILQNLLTISVQKRPVPQQALQQALPQQMLGGVPGGGGAAMNLLQPQVPVAQVNPHVRMPPQQHNRGLTNMQYKNF